MSQGILVEALGSCFFFFFKKSSFISLYVSPRLFFLLDNKDCHTFTWKRKNNPRPIWWFPWLNIKWWAQFFVLLWIRVKSFDTVCCCITLCTLCSLIQFDLCVVPVVPQVGARAPWGGCETQRKRPQDAFQKKNFFFNYNCIFNSLLYKFLLYSFSGHLKIIFWLLSCCSFVLYWCLCGPNSAMRSCAPCYTPPPASMGVPSLWHRYFGGCGLKSLGTPVIY